MRGSTTFHPTYLFNIWNFQYVITVSIEPWYKLNYVSQRDSSVAKLLFGAIFKGIFSKMDEVKTEREVQETIQQIQKSIGVVLTTSIQYFTPFISCLLVITTYQLTFWWLSSTGISFSTQVIMSNYSFPTSWDSNFVFLKSNSGLKVLFYGVWF